MIGCIATLERLWACSEKICARSPPLPVAKPVSAPESCSIYTQLQTLTISFPVCHIRRLWSSVFHCCTVLGNIVLLKTCFGMSRSWWVHPILGRTWSWPWYNQRTAVQILSFLLSNERVSESREFKHHISLNYEKRSTNNTFVSSN